MNLYPFAQVAARHGVREEEAVEMIDVGGPSMLRAAAKNFAHVAPVSRPEQYGAVLAELRAAGELSLETRRSLATVAFSTTAAYESAIARWFADVEAFPEQLVPSFSKVLDLSYGENPHQRGAFYAEAGARVHLLSRVEQLHGKELSYNNLNDLSAARLLAAEFTLPACVIVKHANPCGIALAATIEEAYAKALASDPTSAYGGVVVLNRPVSAELGAALAKQFVEVLFAPGYDDAALDALKVKQGTRILSTRSADVPTVASATTSACSAGCSSRTATSTSRTARGWSPSAAIRPRSSGATSSSPGASCKHVTSNAIVHREGPADGRHRRRPAVARRRRAPRGREGARARARPRRRGARVGRVLPVRGRPAARARRRRVVDHPARRLEARRRGRRGGRHGGAVMVFTGRRHFRH